MGYVAKDVRPRDSLARKATHTEDKDYEPGGAQRQAGAPASMGTPAAPRNPNHWYNRKPKVVRSTKEDRSIAEADKAVGDNET